VPKGLLTIICAGALCGVLDISAACIDAYITSGLTPEHVLQGVAGGLLGRSAFQGGLTTATLGLVMHFTMAMTMATVFYAVTRGFPLPQKLSGVIALGMCFGAAVFVANNFVTAPFLSWVRSLYLHTPVLLKPPMGLTQFVIHLFCVGLPIALVTRLYSVRH
jgi:hypothetical protein